MKKYLISALSIGLTLLSGSALADKTLSINDKNVKFAPTGIDLTLNNPAFSIQYPSVDGQAQIRYNVQITVSNPYNTAVTINGCNTIAHINTASTFICPLNATNNRIDFILDDPQMYARATINFQIEKI